MTEPRKGVAVLLAALPAIAAVEPEVEVWLSGPGDPAALIAAAPPGAAERVRALGIGAADAQPERYGRAWVTCLPSTHDSFGMALLESLACGTPLVTTTHSCPAGARARGGDRRPVPARGSARHWPPPACGAWRWPAGPRPRTRAARRPSRMTGTRGLAPLCERLYARGALTTVAPDMVPALTTVLITGAGGYVGGRLAAAMTGAGALTARALSRDPAPWLAIPEAVLRPLHG